MFRTAHSTLKISLVAGALLCAPIAARAQTTDSTTASSYTTTETTRHFDWGWLGLLGLLGLLPRKRKETVVETRTTTGTGPGTTGRY